MSGATTAMVVSRTGSLQMSRGLSTDTGFLAVYTSRQGKICIKYAGM